MSPSGLAVIHTKNRYSVDLKTAGVEAYLHGEGSIMWIFMRFGLRSNKLLRNLIKVNNGYKDFRPTESQRSEIYMIKERSTTLEEQIEITSYCITNGKDYGTTIEKYGVSYQQIYSWVRKYEAVRSINLKKLSAPKLYITIPTWV